MISAAGVTGRNMTHRNAVAVDVFEPVSEYCNGSFISLSVHTTNCTTAVVLVEVHVKLRVIRFHDHQPCVAASRATATSCGCRGCIRCGPAPRKMFCDISVGSDESLLFARPQTDANG